MMTDDYLNRFLESTESYIQSGGKQPIDSTVRDFFVSEPFSWKAFHALGTVLESEGDITAARECYKGVLVDRVQKRFFNEDIHELTNTSFHGTRVEAHPISQVTPVSPSIATTFQLRDYCTRTLAAKPTYVHQFSNVNLWFDGFNTAVFSQQGDVDAASLVGNLAPVLHAARSVEANHVKGLLVHMGGPGTHNFFHWMVDVLPKLGVLDKAGVLRDKNTRYLFSGFSQTFHIETLAQFGIDASQIYLANHLGRHISAERLVIPVLENTMGLTMGGWLPEYLRQQFGINPAVSRHRKILVSRDAARSHGRGITNLAQFNQYFIERGYEPLLPEKYSVAEQAKFFSEATHVAGPHGAGLTNLSFCLPGTKVYEFYGDHLAPCYWALSELSGLDYLNHDNSSVDLENTSALERTRTVNARRSSSFSVDLSTIDADHVEG